jgi:hypothetical protein
MNKYTVTFQVEADEEITLKKVIGLEDLILTAVLPSLNLSPVSLSFEVKKTRK